MEKMEAHKKGLLHRAFSVFIFNDKGELLLQKRASHKYHSGGLWTNTCCSHPRPEETLDEAVHRRLVEEMGFDCPVKKSFSFIYKTTLDKGLSEHELDHVYIGQYNGSPLVNAEEVEDWKYMHPEKIRLAIKNDPNSFTVWFKIAFEEVLSFISI